MWFKPLYVVYNPVLKTVERGLTKGEIMLYSSLSEAEEEAQWVEQAIKYTQLPTDLKNEAQKIINTF